MLNVLREILNDETAFWGQADKTVDQFEGLGEVQVLPPKSFHRTSSLNRGTTGEKRKSAEDASQSGTSKRLKPTTCLLPPHQEEDREEPPAAEEPDA